MKRGIVRLAGRRLSRQQSVEIIVDTLPLLQMSDAQASSPRLPNELLRVAHLVTTDTTDQRPESSSSQLRRHFVASPSSIVR